MRKIIKLITLFVGISLSILSCLLDDKTLTDGFNDNPNFSTFTKFTQNLSAVANGDTYTYPINLEVQGPTVFDMTGDVTATISVDESSTAVEGVHYTFDTNSVTLVKSNDYLGQIPIDIITEGLTAPMSVELILSISMTSSDTPTVSSIKTTTISIIYQCFADLSGTYMVTNDFCSPTSFEATITANTDGSWHLTVADGGYLHTCTGNSTLLNAGNISELCGEILPSTDLDFGTDSGNEIGDVLGGTWDAVTGILILNNRDLFFNGGPYEWTSTYVRQ